MRQHRIFAACYDRMMAPMEREVFGKHRAELLGELTGDVLDVGAGTGVNLPHLTNAAKVVAAEPDDAMRRKLSAKLPLGPAPVELSDAPAESLPFGDDQFDAVLCTLVLCTIGDPARALAEARRVLKPGGRLVVLEHVRNSGRAARWQDIITPVWRRMGAGCHPNRDTRTAVEAAGFEWLSVTEFSEIPNWVPTSPMLRGVAVPRGDRAARG